MHHVLDPAAIDGEFTATHHVSAPATLARAGSTFRREQAYALQGERVSINRIAALFGVTRQRISALLRERATVDTAVDEAAG